MAEQNDSNLLNFIAGTVEALRLRVDTVSEQMAGMATKVDLINLSDGLRDEMASKNDILRLESEMATKVDLSRVESNLARMESQMATKDGLARLEITMQGEFERYIFASIRSTAGGARGWVSSRPMLAACAACFICLLRISRICCVCWASQRQMKDRKAKQLLHSESAGISQR